MCKSFERATGGVFAIAAPVRAGVFMVGGVFVQQQPLGKAYSKESSVSVRTRAISMVRGPAELASNERSGTAPEQRG